VTFNSLSAQFHPPNGHSKTKKSFFFSELPYKLKPLPWSDPTSPPYN
jgi:hypothetical protein